MSATKYTKEQIDEAKNDAKNARPSDIPNALAVQDCIILYDALTAAERERDEAVGLLRELRTVGSKMRRAHCGEYKQAIDNWDALLTSIDACLLTHSTPVDARRRDAGEAENKGENA